MAGRVAWVVDGDTIHMRIGSRLERVRYIGVNAPEIPHPESRGWREGGVQAHAMNLQLVAKETAWLELDSCLRDSHGRLLAYVWVRAARTPVMANAEMVRRGFAQVMTIPPNVRYQALFLGLQREAREAGLGLWAGA